MNGPVTLPQVLRVEDSDDLLAPRCRETGIPLWTTLRFPFFRLILGDLLYGNAIVGRAVMGSSRLAAPGKLLKLARSVAHNEVWMQRRRAAYPVLLMPTGARLVQRDGRYFNCLSDHFVGALPERTVALESMFEWRWPFPRHYRNTLLHTPLLMAAAFRGRRGADAYAADAEALVDLASARAQALLGWELSADRRAWLVERCAGESSSIAFRYRAYRALFRRLGTRVVVKEEACYGGADNAAIVTAAREMGIRTAEYQHGLISSGHDGYNFAPAVREHPAYRSILPDHLLTYGQWWSDQINAPVTKIPMGNPHRSEILSANKPTAPRKGILVLGDGLDTPKYLTLCEQLARSVPPGQEVVFRPHPLERARIQAQGLGACEGVVRIDARPDIYDSFRESDVVVSEVSTGLFEAIGLVPRVFVWDTPKARFTIPRHPFTGFREPEELLELLRDSAGGRVDDDAKEKVWAPHWRNTYATFIEEAMQ